MNKKILMAAVITVILFSALSCKNALEKSIKVQPPDSIKVVVEAVHRYHKSADLKTRKTKEVEAWSSTVKNVRNRRCYCQMI